MLAKWYRRALVEENLHSRCFQAMSRVLQNGAGLLHGDARKPFHEIGKLRAILEILEKSDNRHTRATKHPTATNALGITLYSRA